MSINVDKIEKRLEEFKKKYGEQKDLLNFLSEEERNEYNNIFKAVIEGSSQILMKFNMVTQEFEENKKKLLSDLLGVKKMLDAIHSGDPTYDNLAKKIADMEAQVNSQLASMVSKNQNDFEKAYQDWEKQLQSAQSALDSALLKAKLSKISNTAQTAQVSGKELDAAAATDLGFLVGDMIEDLSAEFEKEDAGDSKDPENKFMLPFMKTLAAMLKFTGEAIKENAKSFDASSAKP